MKGLTGFIAIFFLTFSGFSQLITDNSLTPFQLVNDVLIGVELRRLTFNLRVMPMPLVILMRRMLMLDLVQESY